MPLYDYVFDNGLNAIDALADRIYLCAGEPTTFSEATTAGNKALGSKTFGTGGVINGTMTDATPTGRKVTTNAITGGTTTNSGTATHWAIVDFANSRLLAVGTVTSVALTAGAGFNMNAFNVTIPATVSGSAAYNNFIARTSGLDATHTNAYKELLDGLTEDGLFNSDGTTNYFDFLYIFATQDATTALLSLVNSTFDASNANSLTFTADDGFTGDSTVGHYINSNFNSTTASSPKYTRNSAHISAWSLTSSASGGQIVSLVGNPNNTTNIITRLPGDETYMRVNDNSASGAIATNTDGSGHYIGNRSAFSARQAYKNGSSMGTYGSVDSGLLENLNIEFLESSNIQIAAGSAGASLDATQASNFYNRLRTYMTAVGVP